MASLPLEMGFTPGDLGNSIFRQPAICSRKKLRVSRVGVRLRPSLDSLSFLAHGAVWVWVCMPGTLEETVLPGRSHTCVCEFMYRSVLPVWRVRKLRL